MDMDKLKKNIESSEKIEELLMVSSKVFGKSTDDVKKVIEMFITKSYWMGKQNMVKSFDD